MSELIPKEKNLSFSINNKMQHEEIAKLGKALNSLEHLAILQLLQVEPKYIAEISEAIDVPLSSVSRHIDVLAEAGLIFISYEPGPKGHSKLCSKAVLNASVNYDDLEQIDIGLSDFSIEMPIGLYSDCQITSPCGMVGYEEPVGQFDNPAVFFSPERINAELIWFNIGFITYKFPIQLPHRSKYEEISFSFEVCSETIYHRNKWPSDITVMVNDIELTTFTSPGDFGGRRGKLTPEYWPIISTQYGLLMKYQVNEKGVFVNNVLKNDSIKIADLGIGSNGHDYVKFTLAIKEDAVHKGGINLFGKRFGDFAQSIILTLR